MLYDHPVYIKYLRFDVTQFTTYHKQEYVKIVIYTYTVLSIEIQNLTINK